MKAGKAAEAVLRRSVLKAVRQQKQSEKGNGAGVGKDAGLFDIQAMPGSFAMSCALHCGTEQQASSIAVFRACNSLAAAGASPEFVTVQVTLPESAEEAELKCLMAQILEACRREDVTLAQGHTEISRYVQAPHVSVTAFGKSPGLPKKSGMALVMTKYAGISGTALLASKYHERLQKRFPSLLIEKAEALYNMVSVRTEAELAAGFGITAMHDVAEGGVFGAVWELAERENIGLTLDLRKIPIRQETVEVCEFFDINPYQLKGDGALLILTDESIRLISAFEEAGIPAAVIGMVTENNDRILKNGDEVRFLEPNRMDDYETAVAQMEALKGE